MRRLVPKQREEAWQEQTERFGKQLDAQIKAIEGALRRFEEEER